MDFLSSWMQNLTDQNFLIPPFPQCKPCLLYADDTLFLLKPDRSQLLKSKLILDIFGRISGLKVNPLKSELAITSPRPSQAQDLADVIHCNATSFPIRYLGLPLSGKKLAKADYLPLINKVERVLPGWKASLLTIGGRLILTNAVLAAIPYYFMSVFMLPTWVTHRIDQIRKRFLWHSHKEQQRQLRSLYMVNWTLATKPKDQGGLGVREIRIANQALLMKWMWSWHDHSHMWWKEPSQMANVSTRPWEDSHSTPFWKSVSTCSLAFDCSIKFQIGDGKRTSFWRDNWNGTPLKYVYPNLYEETANKNESVHQYFHASILLPQAQPFGPLAQSEKAHLTLHLQPPIFTQDSDSIIWLRNTSAFSVGSAYHFLAHSPTPTTNLHKIWSIKAPLRVIVFSWLMLSNRLATTENLIKRGWNLPSICVLCRMSEESTKHLFQQCSLSKEIRTYIYSTMPTQQSISPKFCTEDSIQMLTDPTENLAVRQWELVTCFIMWRERCRRVFSNKTATQLMLIREIRSEFKCWFGTASV